MSVKLNSVAAIVGIFILAFSIYDETTVKCDDDYEDEEEEDDYEDDDEDEDENQDSDYAEDEDDEGDGEEDEDHTIDEDEDEEDDEEDEEDDDEDDDEDEDEDEEDDDDEFDFDEEDEDDENSVKNRLSRIKSGVKGLVPPGMNETLDFGDDSDLEAVIENIDARERKLENINNGLVDKDDCGHHQKQIVQVQIKENKEVPVKPARVPAPRKQHAPESFCDGEVSVAECGRRVKEANERTFESLIKALNCEIDRVEKALGKEKIDTSKVDITTEYDTSLVNEQELRKMSLEGIRAKLKRMVMYFTAKDGYYKGEKARQDKESIKETGEDYLETGKSFERALKRDVKQMVTYSENCDNLVISYCKKKGKPEPGQCQLDSYVLQRIKGELYPPGKN